MAFRSPILALRGAERLGGLSDELIRGRSGSYDPPLCHANPDGDQEGDTAPMKTAVLIPCYNEALTVRKVVEDFLSLDPDATVYVYDNNSTDGTAEIAVEAGAAVVQEYRQGKGRVVRSMFRNIDADVYVMVDGDDTYPADEALALRDLVISGQADMVIGDRLSSTYFDENKRRFHGFGNKLVRLLVNRLFESDIRDIMTGCRCFSRSCQDDAGHEPRVRDRDRDDDPCARQSVPHQGDANLLPRSL